MTRCKNNPCTHTFDQARTHDTQWIPATDAELPKTAQVKLEHGDGSVLYGDLVNRVICTNSGTNTPVSWRDGGWNLFWQATPKPAHQLPTVPGIYSDNKDGIWRFHIDGTYTRFDSVYCPPEVAIKYAPFVRLAPVADTAKAVIDRVIEKTAIIHYSKLDHETFDTYVIKPIVAEFGATD